MCLAAVPAFFCFYLHRAATKPISKNCIIAGSGTEQQECLNLLYDFQTSFERNETQTNHLSRDDRPGATSRHPLIKQVPRHIRTTFRNAFGMKLFCLNSLHTRSPFDRLSNQNSRNNVRCFCEITSRAMRLL